MPFMAKLTPKVSAKRSPGRRVEGSLLGFDKVWFTNHVLQRMRKRQVTQGQIFEAIRNPTKRGLRADPADRKRLRVRKRLGMSKQLDVVYEEWDDENELVVVTAILIG